MAVITLFDGKIVLDVDNGSGAFKATSSGERARSPIKPTAFSHVMARKKKQTKPRK